MNRKRKYKIISEDLLKCLVEFLDDAQMDALASKDKEDLHKINFCSWAIEELLNSYDCQLRYRAKGKGKDNDSSKRNQIIDDHFDDWEMPKDMSDDEFEKLVGQLDAFVRGWEKEYNKKKPESKTIERKRAPKSVVEHMSLKEIEQYLLEDEELSDNERFELYYQEHCRVQEEKEIAKGYSLDKMCKDLKIGRNPGKN